MHPVTSYSLTCPRARTKSFGIPANLGELPVGVLLGAGAVNLLHVHLLERGQAAGALMLLAQVGAVVLMFMAASSERRGISRSSRWTKDKDSANTPLHSTPSCRPLKGVAGKPIPLKAGDLVVLPAEKPHAVKAITRFKMVLTMIRS